jgi:acyl transferase domain-containing protein
MAEVIEAGSRIAVVGMAARYPGADNLDQYWANLLAGRDCLTPLSREELLATGEVADRVDDPSYVPVHGRITDPAGFDAQLFGYSPRDATLIDPQQRVFLECAWEALDHAGHDPRSYPGTVGVYAGCPLSTYSFLLYLHRGRTKSSADEYQFTIAAAPDHIATRTSYKLGLTGPSVTVLATCATSLVAIHQACQALLGGECDMALAGGSSIRVPPRGYVYHEGGVLSPDGRVRAYDAAARGMAGGDGTGVVVLKRLDDAIADGDRIHAVVLGSAVNNLGADRVGYMAPSVAGQADVVHRAHLAAAVDPGTISYVEGHGSGTPVGDPIEVAALTKAFRLGTDKVGFCGLGSVKTNIGHTDAAAGVAGFIKTVLALEHQVLPASLHFKKPNPDLHLDGSPFYVNAERRDWPAGATPRRAGVSSFGMGGTNAHVVLEEAPQPVPSGPALPWQLVVLSARTPTALATAGRNLVTHLTDHPDIDLADAAFTLQAGRQPLRYRQFAVCADGPDAISALSGARGRPAGAAQPARERDVVFMFPGQGAQRVGMTGGLYEHLPEFRERVDECCALLAEPLGLDLRDLLYPRPEQADRAAELIHRTEFSQPALFVVDYVLAQVLMSWGVRPSAAVGHSLGEFVAACLAGVFELPEALRLVADRARMMQQQPSGSMLSVTLREAELRPLLGPDLSLAAVNGAARCVVSGPTRAVDELAARLAGTGADARPVRASVAAHSALMDPILDAFADRVARAAPRPPSLPYVTNVSGTWVSAEEATDPAHWRRHLRDTVRFADCLSTLINEADRVLVEVGPGQSLTALARQHPAAGMGSRVVPTQPRADERTPDLVGLLSAIGQLWAAGTPIPWTRMHGRARRRRVALPSYPFERKRFLLDPLPLLTGIGNGAASSLPAGPAGPAPAAAAATVDSAEPERTGAVPADPGSGVQDRVIGIFSTVLGFERIGPEDDFYELGGDSLTATQLTSRVREALGVEVPLDTIFEASTVAAYSAAVAALLPPATASTAGTPTGTAGTAGAGRPR